MRNWVLRLGVAVLTVVPSLAFADDSPVVQSEPLVPRVSQTGAPSPHPAPIALLAPSEEFPSYLDSSLPTGIVDLSIGVTLVALGAMASEDAEFAGGTLGMGLGTLAVGIPMFAVGTQRVRYARRSEPLYAVGTVLASLGGSLAGLGVGIGVGDYVHFRALTEAYAYDEPYRVDGSAIGLGVAGSLFGLLGAAFMVPNAIEAEPELAARITTELHEEAEARAEADAVIAAGDEDGLVPRSVPRRTAGQVLVTIGGLSFVGAAISGAVFADCSGDFCGFTQLLVTLPLAGHGVITTAIGIPLWVSGAALIVPSDEGAGASEERGERAAEEAPAWTPELNLGAGTATMTMRF